MCGFVPEAASVSQRWVGASVPRKEDAALLTGGARFIDDLSPLPGIRFAAILRSPHPHARIVRIDATRARALPGVRDVVTGSDLAALIGPVPSVVKAPVPYYPIAIDRARYVGEPVAVVVAETRYIAEDACDLIEVEYDVLPAAADLRSATAENAPLIHDKAGSNVISRRTFRYGDPETAFAEAARVFELSYSYPRYASTPMETFGVIAHFERAPDRLHRLVEFPGAVRAAAPHGRRVARARPSPPPDHAAEQRRQLRHQAGDPVLHRSARGGQPQGRRAGQVDRGSRRAPHGRLGVERSHWNDVRRLRRRRRADGFALSQRRQYGGLHSGARAGVALPDACGLERLLSGRRTSPSRTSSSSPIARRSD